MAMIAIRPQIVRPLVLAAALAAAAAGGYARAQDDDETDERIAAGPGNPRPLDFTQKQLARLRAALAQQLDQLGGRRVRDPARREASVRGRLEIILAGRLERQKEDWNLTDAQVETLRLAGRGDIKHFLDRLDDLARILNDANTDFGDLRDVGSAISEAANTLENGFFREDSLYFKVLARQLNLEQHGDREKALLERNRRRYEAVVAQAVDTMHGTLGLTERQSTQLADLLLSNTLPPRRFGKASDVALVLFQASKIPTEVLKPVFNETQWRSMSLWLSRYRDRNGIEGALRRNGFIFDADPPGARPGSAGPAMDKEKT
jgi:hypothetical protein